MKETPHAPAIGDRAPRTRAHQATLIFVAVLLLSLMDGAVAEADNAPHWGSTFIAGAPSALPTRPARHRLKPGMVVLDRKGRRVGLIRRTNLTKDGRPAVSILVNGTAIAVRKSRLRISRDRDVAVISLTRSQIRTAAILNTF
jgi:hypothetical protein